MIKVIPGVSQSESLFHDSSAVRVSSQNGPCPCTASVFTHHLQLLRHNKIKLLNPTFSGIRNPRGSDGITDKPAPWRERGTYDIQSESFH
jgi:hypothetical protein